MIKNNRLVPFLLLAIFLFNFLMPDTIYAAQNDVYSNNGREFIQEMEAIQTQFSLDTESPGALDVNGAGAAVINSLSNMVFAWQVIITYLTLSCYSLSTSTSADGLFSTFLNKDGTMIFGNLFTENGNAIMILAIAFTMLFVTIAFFKQSYSGVLSQIGKFLTIFVLGVILVTNAGTVHNCYVSVTKSLSDTVVQGLSQHESVEEVVWDTGVIKPWKLLQFQNTNIAESKASDWGKAPNDYCESLKLKMKMTGVKNLNKVTINKSVKTNEMWYQYLISEPTNSEGFRKDVLNKATADMQEDGETNNKGGTISSLKPLISTQSARFAQSIMLFVINLMICLVVLVASIASLVIKFLMFLAILLAPIIMIFAWFSPEGMNILRRGGFLALTLMLAATIISVILTIYVIIVGGMMNSAGIETFADLVGTLLVLVALVLAIRYGGKPLLRIVSPKSSAIVQGMVRQSQMLNAMNKNDSGQSTSKRDLIGAATGDVKSMGRIVKRSVQKTKDNGVSTADSAKAMALKAREKYRQIQTGEDRQTVKEAVNAQVEAQKAKKEANMSTKFAAMSGMGATHAVAARNKANDLQQAAQEYAIQNKNEKTTSGQIMNKPAKTNSDKIAKNEFRKVSKTENNNRHTNQTRAEKQLKPDNKPMRRKKNKR